MPKTETAVSSKSPKLSTSNNSLHHQLLSTLKWLLVLLFLVTGSITWHLTNENSHRHCDTHLLDLPGRDTSSCVQQYDRVTSNFTKGITETDLEQSRALLGNRHRLALLAKKLQDRETPVNAVFCGGSITLGHGVMDAKTLRYSHRFEVWMNNNYKIQNNGKNSANVHRAFNYGSHGADMCAMAKRLNQMLRTLPPDPDLFVLEFAVNDYQGQDHKIHLDHKTEVFFDGFEKLVVCAEVVVHTLLSQFPQAAVLFLEMRTAITNRKSAESIHMAVAKHYEVPVVSFAETFFPDFYRLLHKLKPYNYSTATIRPSNPNSLTTATTTTIADPVLPYPHGCSPCLDGYIVQGFRKHGCKSLCVFAKRSGQMNLNCDRLPPGREPCYVSFLAHDAVHLSAVGHQMAAELVAEAIARTARELCQERIYPPQILPTLGLMVSDPNMLTKQHNFVHVKDTMEMFGQLDPLVATNHSQNFTLYGDFIDRPGYIATNPRGNEFVEFWIDLPAKPCYAVWLAVLKSYENMGTFTAILTDLTTGKETITKVDCLWKPKISIPSDIPITKDDVPGCTGNCKVRVVTDPKVEGRGGNKVKIMTLSARECVQ